MTLLAMTGVDMTRPPAAQWTTHAALAGIAAYQHSLSPLMPKLGVGCRFTPTCSRYSAAVLRKYGFVRGSALTLRRLARCGPWTPIGTRDEP